MPLANNSVRDDGGMVMTDITGKDTPSMRVVDPTTNIKQPYADACVVHSHMNKRETCCRQHKLYSLSTRLSAGVTVKHNCKLQNETGFV